MTKGNLTSMGFERVAHFEPGVFTCRIVAEREDHGGTYAFIVGDEIRYVGTTGRSVLQRYSQYDSAPLEQIRRKWKRSKQVFITEELRQGNDVEVFHLSDEKLKCIEVLLKGNGGENRVNADRKLLERFLISLFRPIWNKD